MKKTHALISKLRTLLPGAVLFLVVFGVLSVTSDSLAIYNNVRVSEDGGGGGGDYTIPRARIPEITPTRQAAELQVSDTFTGTVEAEESYNVQIPGTYWYAWNRFMTPSNSDTAIQGYVTALGQPNITIGYGVTVLDADTNQSIERGSTVAVGDKLKYVFAPYVSDDIFWFGTGYSMDSPYGEWRANAAPPARVGGKVTCESKDFTAKYFLPGYNLTFDVYIPFVVHPPARSLKDIPSNLTCDAPVGSGTGSVSTTCTVTAQGAIEPKFRYESTYGKFYYRYYDYRNMGGGWGGPGCYGNNIPMTTAFGNSTGPAYNNQTSIRSASQVDIPAREIPYPLTAGPGSNPPGAPTLVCPSSSVDIGDNVVVTVSATDPDGDQIRYGVDWIDDGANEVNSGWSELVSSGSPSSFTKTGGYSSAGTRTIYGIAEDANSARSVWGSCTVVVSSAPECSDSSDNDGDGRNNYGSDPGCSSSDDNSEDPDPSPAPTAELEANPDEVLTGGSSTLTWSSTNATSCTGSGFSTGGAPDNSTGVSTGPLSANRNYGITCTGPGGSISAAAGVTVTLPGGDLSATPDRVQTGGQSALTWSATNATACTVTGENGFSTVGLAGAGVPTGPIQSMTTFVLTCDGIEVDDATVNVVFGTIEI